jgi:hypothetical protein
VNEAFLIVWQFGHKELNAELAAMSRDQQQAWLNDLIAEAICARFMLAGGKRCK